ncbi:MAG: 2-methoxy-6-polyprenyl-1,4-benzoquinol methylase, mitochondrial [Candidatus Celerinatantimonas neptuna]|nr:MAG: 2-methoxy-6-polyprenyl-1,4-benzoquinol methylase, mitochondrial [Candidatus Celerinatantimonas neptuna]
MNHSKEAAINMNQIANTIFKPIYAVIAKNILDDSRILTGTCLDIGSGPGHLAIEIAKRSDLNIYTLDISKAMNDIAESNIFESQTDKQIKTTLGNVEDIPFENDYFDLIVSRGSVYFWEDHIQAFSEIKRVLKVGGAAFIGGGFGNTTLKDRIIAQMREKNPQWENASKKRGEKFNLAMADDICRQARIDDYDTIDDGRGKWLIIHKND